MPVDEAGEADASVPDRARAGRLQIRLPQVRGGCRSAAAHPLEAGAMKWVDDLKALKSDKATGVRTGVIGNNFA